MRIIIKWPVASAKSCLLSFFLLSWLASILLLLLCWHPIISPWGDGWVGMLGQIEREESQRWNVGSWAKTECVNGEEGTGGRYGWAIRTYMSEHNKPSLLQPNANYSSFLRHCCIFLWSELLTVTLQRRADKHHIRDHIHEHEFIKQQYPLW